MTTPRAYYNEIDPFAAQWLRNLIAAGHLPAGDVDERSIVDVRPSDLAGYVQCHFFAGIGGWPYAARLAGWPDDRPLWTGSCPCQPFSVAGKGLGTDDVRHLWPDFLRLIRAVRPPVVMGEQVAGSAGYGWLDGVVSDLASEGYAGRGVDIPACAVDAPHIRSRLYWVARDMADAAHGRRGEEYPHTGRRGAGDSAQGRPAGLGAGGEHSDVEDAARERREGWALAGQRERTGSGRPLPAGSGELHRLDDADHARLEGHAGHGDDRAGRARAAGPATATGRGDVADASRQLPHGAWREGRGRGEYSDGRGGDMADAGRFGQARGEERNGGAAERQRPAPFGHDDARRGHSDDGRSAAERRLAGALDPSGRNGTFWSDHIWLTGADGKARRAQPGIPLLAHGVPGRVGKLRAYGNAIVPQVAAQVIGAFMEAAA